MVKIFNFYKWILNLKLLFIINKTWSIKYLMIDIIIIVAYVLVAIKILLKLFEWI